MKRWLQIGYLLLLANFSFAQMGSIDSLLQLLHRAPIDTNRILLLLNIGNYYEGFQLDSAEIYYRQALQLCNKLNEPFYEGKTISWFTDVLNAKGQLEEALKLNLRGLEIGKELNHTRLKVASLANVATTYQFMGNYEATLQYQLESLPVLEEMGDELFLSSGLSNIAITYIELRQFEKAIPYAQRALKLARKHNSPFQTGPPLLALGQISSNLNQSDQALQYFEEALHVAEHSDDPRVLTTALLDIAEEHKKNNRFQQALQYLERGLPGALEYNEKEITARFLLSLGDVYFALHQFPKSANYLRQAIDTSRKYGFRDVLHEAYLAGSDAEFALQNYDQSSMYRHEFHLLSDSLINETVLKNTTESETRYKTAQQRAEIANLQSKNEIQELRLRQRQGVIIGMGIFLGLLISLGLMYYQNAQNKQQIARQEIEIGHQKILQLEQEKQLSAVNAMLQGQEEERGRLARDLHDGLGGMLSGVRQTLNFMKGNQILNEQSARSFSRALEMLDTSIDELRRVARNMMPEALLKFGLKDAVQDLCDTLNESSTLKVQNQAFGLEHRLPESTEVIVFRIVQELLNNVAKHAGASRALVQLLRDGDRFHITVEDNGKGFDLETLEKASGIGWMNIRSRVDYLNGTLDMRSKPVEGTTVEIEFKVNKKL